MGTDSKADLKRVAYLLASIFFVVVALIAGRELLLPLAIAVLLAFLLTPLVAALERRRVPRALAVLGVILVIFSAMAFAGWSISTQLTDLATHLPTYQKNLHDKLASVKLPSAIIQLFKDTVDGAGVQIAADNAAVPQVRVVPDSAVPFEQVRLLATMILAPLANAVIILALVIFMLINREDLRNRLVRLMGKRLALTTRTLDAVGDRISRYLLLNALVNGGFGLLLAIGLSIIGVQYAFTWGLLAAMLRFIPYVGSMLAALMPVTMAFIQFPGDDWHHAAYAAGLFLVMELVAANVIEPLVYGPHTGVSTVSLLVAAMFWSWVWGPLGLVLAVPMTVVLAVLGEYVETLEPLAILLGDKPALDAFIVYYQRLLAGDVDEATTIFEAAQKSPEPLAAYDHIVIPAMALAQKDAANGELLDEEQETIWQSIKDQIEGQQLPTATVCQSMSAEPPIKAKIVACPAHDAADGMCLDMLSQGLHFDNGGSFETISATMLAGEMASAIAEQSPDAVIISALGSSNLRSARYLCTRLRQACPQMRILIGYWGQLENREQLTTALRGRGADQLVTSLAEARDALQRITPLSVKKSDDAPKMNIAAPAA